jgi:hypothetical protein
MVLSRPMAAVLRRTHRPVDVGGSLRSGNVVLETGQNIDRGGPDGCEGANTSPAAPAGPITPPTAAPPASR